MDTLPTNSEAAAEPNPVENRRPPVRAASLCTFAQMHLKVGDRAHLELPSQIGRGRVSVTVLGWLERESFIVTAPQTDAGCLVLHQGELVRIRAFTGKSAFTFSATVEKMAYLPFHYMHLTFPDKVEGVDIRSSPRCSLTLPVVITAVGAAAIQANILNIGTSGALIETALPLGDDKGMIQIALSFELHGVTVSLDLHAQVRGKKSSAAGNAVPRHQYGVEFSNLQPNDQLMLGSLVYYELYEHPRNVV